MSHSQKQLGEFGVESLSPASQRSLDHGRGTHKPKLGFNSRPPIPECPDSVANARNADWVVHTGRYPHIFDAARLGFTTGHREDLSYGWTPKELTLRTDFLDNDYEDPDLGQFVETVRTHRPDIAVLGDIYTIDELQPHLDAADQIWSDYPDIELILVPKCESVLEEIPESFIIGFPNGSSDIQALDVAPYSKWREQPNRIHILGGPPVQTQQVIRKLTRESLTDEPPADIAGLDWNGYQRYAQQYGDYADATGGWHENLRNQYYPKRDLIRWSLLNAKHFYIASGIWPTDDIGEAIADLPLRDQLQKAAADTTMQYRPDAHRDVRVLQSSPGWQAGIDAEPLFRTDESQDIIFEPLSPLAFLYGTSCLTWRPAGKSSSRTTARIPDCHRISTVCPGCGVDIRHRPDQARGSTDGPLTAPVVSYDQHRFNTDEHYESARRGDVEGLSPTPNPGFQTSYPTVQLFCSDTCQAYVENRAPRQLLRIEQDTQIDLTAPLNGAIIGHVEIP